MHTIKLSSLLFFFVLCYATAMTQAPALVLQKGHFKRINSVSFSKNGRQILTTSDDGLIKIWDAFSQKLVNELGGNGVGYLDAYFSSTGKYVIARSQQAGESEAFGTTEIYNNPQYHMLYNHTPSYIWNTETNQLVYSATNDNEFNRISPNAEFAAIHPDKKTTIDPASGLRLVYDYPISIYHVATGKLYKVIKRFEDSTFENEPLFEFVSDSVLLTGFQTFLPAQQLYVTKYLVFNFVTGDELASFNDTSRINKGGGLVVSPGGKYFLRYDEELFLSFDSARSHAAFTELWDISRGKMIWQRAIRLRNFQFSNNNSTLVFIHETATAPYNPEVPYTRHVIQLAPGNPGKAYELKADYKVDVSAAASREGTLFAMAGMEEQEYQLPVPHTDTSYRVNAWDTAHMVKSNFNHKQGITAMVFSPDEKFLVTGYADGNFGLWDMGDSLGQEIANSGNIIDPVIQVHTDKATRKVYYVTNRAYGFNDDHSLSKFSFFPRASLPVKNIRNLFKDKYSVLNLGEQYIIPGKFVLVNNDTPSIVKEFPYDDVGGSSLVFQGDSAKVDMFNREKWVTRLHHRGLDALTIFSKMVSYDNPRRHMMHPDVLLTYGILKGSAGTDTALLSSSLGDLPYNDQLKGYIFTYDIPYLVRKSRLTEISPIFPKPPSSFLAAPIISNDGRYLLGQDLPGINTSGYYYCQDLKGTTVFKTPVNFLGDSLGAVTKFIIGSNRLSGCILSPASLSGGGPFVRVISLKNGKPLFNLKVRNGGNILGAEYTNDCRYLYSWSESGGCTKWDLADGKEVFTMVFFQDHDYAIILPAGYYYISSRTDAKYLNFKVNNKLYNFSQFDLQFNRPDKVLQAIGSTDKSLINEYYRAWEGRVKKSGFAEVDPEKSGLHVPDVILKDDSIPPYTTTRQLRLAFTVSDSLYSITSYNIFVNDVPIHGINGKALFQPARQMNITEPVILSAGENKIEVNCTNEKGATSRKETVYINYGGQTAGRPRTWFVGIGINEYSAQSSFVDLSYCVKDIRDLGSALKIKFGDNLVTDTLMNNNASRENILALKQKLMQTAVDDRVIISFSGHGMVDPAHPDNFFFVTGNTDANNPADRGVSYAQLEALLDSIPARKKLLLLDACHSGETDEHARSASGHIPGTKRGSEENDKNRAGSIEILDVVENAGSAQLPAANIFKLMKEAFVDIRRNNGAYVISAAQSNESAGEGGGITNGWFTSCLIEQLNHNATMTVDELRRKVNQCVSMKSGGNQNTDNRQELVEVDWKLW